ncbi:hypothetical protein MMC30_001194 [Trapelia coarctata]|nr:hypothetical protein [Trapelia coarctata]
MSIAEMPTETPSSSSSEHIFVKIGEGWCGVVYHYTNTGAVFKKEKRGITTLFNDFDMQNRVWQCFCESDMLFGSSSLPRTTCPVFHAQANSTFWQKWWKDNGSKFPEEERGSPASFLFTERIPPVPLENQEDLIDKFCPEAVKDSAKESLENKKCIVRLYLGRRKRRSNTSRFFSLKNFLLHIDMAEEWGINVMVCTSQMATGLAVCHWRAQVDANDVEFVLGDFPAAPIEHSVLFSDLKSGRAAAFSEKARASAAGSPETEQELRAEADQEAPAEEPPKKVIPKPMRLWMLDYDKCRRMSYTEEGIRQAARAAEDNDPYFPKPLQGNADDQELWEHFKSSYLDASQKVLVAQGLLVELGNAPMRFLEEWETYRHRKIKCSEGGKG